jgi:pentatricopeptide repeat protein
MLGDSLLEATKHGIGIISMALVAWNRKIVVSSTLHLLAAMNISVMTANARSDRVDLSNHVTTPREENRSKEHFDSFHIMGCAESSTYASILQTCANDKTLAEGKIVHTHIIQTGSTPNVYLETKLMNMYIKCGSLIDGRRIFDEMPTRNVVSWTAMIAAYAKHWQEQEALKLYYQMRKSGVEPNAYTFASILPACANLGSLEQGKEIHQDLIRSGVQCNVFVGSALIYMYVKFGSLEDARKVFDEMPERNVVIWTEMVSRYAQAGRMDEALELFQEMPERDVVSWTAMISAFSRYGYNEEALKLFYQMKRVGIQMDWFSVASVLPACGNLEDMEWGKEVHEEIVRNGFQRDICLCNMLIDMYVKCGSIEDARKVFDEMPVRDIVSQTAMMVGYAQNGCLDNAWELFSKMPERDVASWNAMISGYALNGRIHEALDLFQKMPDRNLVSWNSIIAGCAKNGCLGEAMRFFRMMPEQNVVSWTAVIAGYAQDGQFGEALVLFQQMLWKDVIPDSDTFSTVTAACANLASLEHGKKVHGQIIRSGFQYNVIVGNSLIDMYAKCGSIQNAEMVFLKMHRRNIVSWNGMIVGYALHGFGKEALLLFEQMQYIGLKPDHVSFIGVLSACCHAGLVADGWKYFNQMSGLYHITPNLEHYYSMVDLLGRAGCLGEALDFISTMPMKPDASVWGTLLGACRLHSNVDIGEYVVDRLIDLDPKNAAPYVMLSNIYAAAGRWDGIEKVRKMMKDRIVQKNPGCVEIM